MSEPTRVENLRWWFERWVVGAAYVLRQFRFPVKVNVEWAGPLPSRGLDDAKHEWDQREKFGKTEYGGSRD